MKIGLLQETHPGERRVALVPAQVKQLVKAGHEVLLQSGAGERSGYLDEHYREAGAEVIAERSAVLEQLEALFAVRFAAASRGETVESDIAALPRGALVLGFLEPYDPQAPVFGALAERGVSAVALELLPRITRAQSMDALSATANLAGYRAAVLAAERLPRVFPMMMTAAGTIIPAQVFVLGAGVAGLQAIATAGRLGAVVSAYDVRSAVREQVLSLGAKFVEIEVPDAGADDEAGKREGAGAGAAAAGGKSAAEAAGGYAKEMDEAFYRAQREKLTSVIAESDAVITTAAVPGRSAPRLVTEEMVAGMKPGSVLIDLAAERGGNCELTRAGETVEHHGVQILGPLNIASSLAYTASRLYSKNITALFEALLGEDGRPELQKDDEIVAACTVLRDGELLYGGMRDE